MLQNYLKVALRNFKRQPGYTTLNILGLTIGITASLFILFYITEELSFDQHHEKADRIFRISSDIKEPDNAFKWAVTQFPLGPTLKQNYGEVEEFVRFIPNSRTRLEYEQKNFYEERVFFVDSTVFDVFTFQFLAGNPETALHQPNSVVLAESVAKKIFGNAQDAIGQTLKSDRRDPMNITGVYTDMPNRSHLIADVMISANTLQNIQNAGSWGNFGIYNYVLLKEGISGSSFAAKLPEVIETHVATIFNQFDITVRYALLPLLDIHLKSDFQGEPEPVGEIAFIYIFGAVAIFMLLLAVINYMNLSTARSTQRALEVGMRKVLGSTRPKLISQFITESLLFTLIALALSVALVLTLLPAFNQAFDLNLKSSMIWSAPVLLGLLGIVLITGILGGSYPAFFLSAFKPITVLKGTLSKKAKNSYLRRSLVVVQFVISLFMLIGTGVIYDQMSYVRNKELGYDKEHLLTFEFTSREQRSQWQVIREKMLQNPNIISAATASTVPGDGYGKILYKVETSEGMKDLGIDNYGVDFDFFPTMGIDIIKGRGFSSDFQTDSTLSVLVNEAMVKRMAWEEPIGKKVQFGTVDTLPVARVIGVVKDFHQQSLYEPIEALMFLPRFNNRFAHVKFQGDPGPVIAQLEQEWQSIFTDVPFEYNFVDDSFMELYEADQIRSRIFTLFSVLMIVIACLGLLGLASFTAEQRTKEIGIRKIMGANVNDIILMLTKDFVVLVTIACIPAFLAAWYFMKQWLETFAYHTEMNYLLFGLAFIATTMITLATTGFHAYRAATSNPSEALRYE